MFALIEIGVLTLPGWLFVRSLGLNRHTVLYSLALSFAYYVLVAGLAIAWHWTLTTTAAVYVLGLVAGLVTTLRRGPGDTPPPAHDSQRVWLVLGGCAVLALYALYRGWAGPYLEVPADVYRHLEYIRGHLQHIQQGHLNGDHSWVNMLRQRGGLMYSLVAWATTLSNAALTDTTPVAMAIHVSLFLLACYAFALIIFEPLVVSLPVRAGLSVLAVLLTAAHMGINVFSYFRYYALAPTILNMVLLFAALASLLQLLNGSAQRWQHVGIYLVLLLAMAMVHTQEALFLLTMTFLMVLVMGIQGVVNSATSRQRALGGALSSRTLSTWLHSALTNRLLQAWAVLLMLALITVVWVYLNQPRPQDWFGKVVQVSSSGPVLSRLLFLNPEFQFIRVLTVWGLLVYGLFLWRFKDFLASPYLIAGMISPLFTVFNPVFVDFFLRLDGPHTLWRLLYLVPLHLVAAYWIYLAVKALRARTGWFEKTLISVALMALVALLWPLELGSWKNRYARLTLAPLATENTVAHWQDLLDFLNAPAQRLPRRILTDPVTGYVISGLTPHFSYRYKFTTSSAYRAYRFDFPDYSDQPLARFRGWWLVINDREGEISQAGEMARHWPADIMKVSKYYGSALRAHVQAHPERFRRLWAEGGISVYEISG